jgi:hypothetical protein
LLKFAKRVKQFARAIQEQAGSQEKAGKKGQFINLWSSSNCPNKNPLFAYFT